MDVDHVFQGQWMQIEDFPAVNATLNAASAILIFFGWRAIFTTLALFAILATGTAFAQSPNAADAEQMFKKATSSATWKWGHTGEQFGWNTNGDLHSFLRKYKTTGEARLAASETRLLATTCSGSFGSLTRATASAKNMW